MDLQKALSIAVLSLTDEEARDKYPNVAKLADFINQQHKPVQFAEALLSAAAAVREEAAE